MKDPSQIDKGDNEKKNGRWPDHVTKAKEASQVGGQTRDEGRKDPQEEEAKDGNQAMPV